MKRWKMAVAIGLSAAAVGLGGCQTHSEGPRTNAPNTGFSEGETQNRQFGESGARKGSTGALDANSATPQGASQAAPATGGSGDNR